MKYIAFKRFKGKAFMGMVNIPAGTEIEEINGTLYFNHQPICFAKSQNAYDYFARNDDGLGLKRGALTSGIIKTLSENPTRDDPESEYQKRWDKVWADTLCNAYRRTEHEDHWIWNHAFYNADLITLNYIAGLVGVRR